MSFVGENSGVKVDSKGWGKDDPQCCSEDMDGNSLEQDSSFSSINYSHSGAKLKPKGPEKFIISDWFQNVLVLDDQILRAVPRKTNIHPAIFSVLASHSIQASEKKGNPIFLAVSEGKLCLCCDYDKKQKHPTLQLKKQNLTSLSTKKEPECRPFIFYRKKVGSRNTLESAAHPKWFICTSYTPREPVSVTDKVGESKPIEFSFDPPPKAEMNPSEIID
ncbi:interleukin-37 [Tupaia chinensis]|uniref:interleukin-37 n=1 Tax=Tupaia chinensis TaxID=246437 RepID=UPI000FFCC319|nr:interleukin-37 [Tupaia chinensis]